MLLRAISGSVYVAVIVCCVLFGQRSFTMLMAVFGVIGINEVVGMFTRGMRVSKVAQYLDLLFFASIILMIYFGCIVAGRAQDLIVICIYYLLAYIPLRMIVAVCQKTDSPLRQAAGAFFGFVYVGIPIFALTLTYCLAYKLEQLVPVVLMSFILIWLNDTGAYLSGRTFGRTKLCERLSPKKTWEGFWGGFGLCIVASVVYALICGLPFWLYGLYGAVVSVAATFGDLFESLIKRKCGVKDSGTLIPGHGGILDRIDSFLAVAPITVIFITILVMI